MVSPIDYAMMVLKQWEDVDWEQPEPAPEPQLGDDVDWSTHEAKENLRQHPDIQRLMQMQEEAKNRPYREEERFWPPTMPLEGLNTRQQIEQNNFN